MKTISKSTLFLMCLCITAPAFAEHHRIDHMMEKCDKDKDGKISEMEFMDSKKEHFKMADKNSDGMLDSTEMKDMMKEMHKEMKKAKHEGHPEKD